jgi:hypothetical protein
VNGLGGSGHTLALPTANSIMLPNEVFALDCRAYYEEQGLIVDKRNGEFAHCPYPEGMGETGYYLLHDHHQQQGILQSKDVGQCCFFVGHAKRWLEELDYFPEGYFELWDIYENFSGEGLKKIHSRKDKNGKSVFALEKNKKLHGEKDENGKSKHAVEMGRKSMEEKDEDGKSVHAQEMSKKAHEEKDENGKSALAVKSGKKAHKEKDENGKSKHAVKIGKKGHEKRDENGKSVRALEMNKKLHEKKDELGRSLVAMKVNTQVWESTIDGFRSNAGAVANHNRFKGWDPAARVRVP